MIACRGRTMTSTTNDRAQLKVLPGGRGGTPDPSRDEGGGRPDLRPLALLIATVVLIGIAAAAPLRSARPKPEGVFPLPRLGEFAGEVLHKTAPSEPRPAEP
jgi:hypothetical protein